MYDELDPEKMTDEGDAEAPAEEAEEADEADEEEAEEPLEGGI